MNAKPEPQEQAAPEVKGDEVNAAHIGAETEEPEVSHEESEPVEASITMEPSEAAVKTQAAASATGFNREIPIGAYQVALPDFEGPLDLLLHLIQQHELDISNIPIAFVSKKYVEYITLMHNLNIDLASEYLVMAATLAHIKSKTLLPVEPKGQDDDEVDDLDPRSELVRRLLEYQKYKDAAKSLGESPVLGRDVFLRGAPAPEVDGPAPLAQVSVFKLFDAFQKLIKRAKVVEEHQIGVDRISISERILQLTDLLKGKGRLPFAELFTSQITRSDLVVTFLALLEMTRLKMMQVIQEEPLAPIEIELTLMDEHQEVLESSRESQDDPLAALARGDVDDTAFADALKESAEENKQEIGVNDSVENEE